MIRNGEILLLYVNHSFGTLYYCQELRWSLQDCLTSNMSYLTALSELFTVLCFAVSLETVEFVLEMKSLAQITF